MKVEDWPIDKVTPYEKNPRKNDDAVVPVANSIRDFGWQQPIVVDKAGVVIIGHTRLKAAKYLHLKTVPVLVADFDKDKSSALRLADNKTGEQATWDEDLLEGELAEILSIDMSQYGFGGSPLEDPEIQDDTYTMKVDVPHYQITGVEPKLSQLVDPDKVDELTAEIEKSKVPSDVKAFLRLAATRHYRFDYAAIAEYYSHADKEVQKLFEDSALVIIDFDDAIKDGYVKLSDRLMRMRKGEADE